MKQKTIILFAMVCTSTIFHGADIVWNTEKVISKPLSFAGDNLKITNGAKIIFKGKGTLTLDSGTFCAENAEFSADSILEKDFRITILRSKAIIENCSFQNLKTKEPMKYAQGFMMIRFMPGNVLRENKFEKCSPVAFLNSSKNIINKNSFNNGEGGLYLFHAGENRIADNSFTNDADALVLNNSSLNIITSNRFEECKKAVYMAWASNNNKFYGNSFFSCTIAFLMRGTGSCNLISGALIEKAQNALSITNDGGKNNIFNQGVIIDTPCVLKATKLRKDAEFIIRNSAISKCKVAFMADSGIITVQNCLLWQVKHEFIKKDDAVCNLKNILRMEPKFKNATEFDYRPAEGSPP